MNSVTIDDVLAKPNLHAAWLKVVENQGCAGIDGVDLEDFGRRLWPNLDILANEVRYGTYRPLPLLRVEVAKKDGGIRALAIPCVCDRVLQTAAALILTPILEAQLEDISFAYRRGRSVDQAVARIERLRNRGYQWVVDADISHFFDEVNHRKLLRQLKPLVQDPAILGLIKTWLKAEVVDGKQRYRLSRGLPQGSPISPVLANLYLDRLDEALLDKDFKIIRYADDFVILCKSRQRAERALELTGAVLAQLELCFNQRKTAITHFNRGFRFLGVEFIRSLAFKSAYPPDAVPVEAEAQTLPALEQQDTEPLSAMQQAFLQAGIQPGQFVSKPLSDPTPLSEPAVPEALPPADGEEPGQTYDPRLKTLYLLKHGAVLGKESERFTLRYRGELLQEIPAIHVDQVMVFGNAQITTQAMQFSLRQRIPIFLLSGKGYYYGVVDSFDTEPVLLHRQQFLQAADAPFCLRLASAIVQGKLANSRLLLRRFSRNRPAPVLITSAEQISTMIRQSQKAENLEQLRGYEGHAARIYFQAFASALEPHWRFNGRNKNPPLDPVNALLSYGYTLLFYNVYSFLRARGLNPHVGFLHPLRQGHPALASDMMEEFRALIVDSVVFNIAVNNRLNPEDFTLPQQAGDPCLLSQEARRYFIRRLETKLNTRLRHPGSGLQLDYRRCIEHQVDHLAAVIRGNADTYQPLVLQ